MSAMDDYIAGLDALTERLLSTQYGKGNAQQAWEAAQEDSEQQISGNQFLKGTGRIDGGIGTGDKAARNASGSVTGYAPRRTGGGLVGGSSASGTPGLAAFHTMNPDAIKGNEFSFDLGKPPEIYGPPAPKNLAKQIGGGLVRSNSESWNLPNSDFAIAGTTARALTPNMYGTGSATFATPMVKRTPGIIPAVSTTDSMLHTIFS